MRWLPIASAVFVASIGGVLFGFLSCGGYAWHKEVLLWLLAVAITIATLLQLRPKRPA
jgi:hypothetical protein